MDVVIRPYRPEDRPSVRKIFQDTAFHGESYRNFFDDGEWLADIMTRTYTDHEPASSFVAERNGKIVGYLNGTLDSAAHSARWTKYTLPSVVRKFFTRGIWKSERAWRYFFHGIISAIRRETAFASGLQRDYPAHFHINLDAGVRSQGVGKMLAQAFFDRMRAHHVTGVHVRTSTTQPRQNFFESIGFRMLLKKRLTVWDYLRQPPYFLITYGLHLPDKDRVTERSRR